MSVLPVILEAGDAWEMLEFLHFIAEFCVTESAASGFRLTCCLSRMGTGSYTTADMHDDALRLAALIEEAGSR